MFLAENNKKFAQMKNIATLQRQPPKRTADKGNLIGKIGTFIDFSTFFCIIQIKIQLLSMEIIIYAIIVSILLFTGCFLRADNSESKSFPSHHKKPALLKDYFSGAGFFYALNGTGFFTH